MKCLYSVTPFLPSRSICSLCLTLFRRRFLVPGNLFPKSLYTLRPTPYTLLLLLFPVICSLFPNSARAQTADLSGVVHDPSGAPVPNAEVRAINSATLVERHAKTNETGIYVFPFLTPGEYKIIVQVTGFTTAELQNVTLTVGDRRNLDVTLRVTPVAQTVTVDASGVAINTTDASVSTVVDRQFAENLPMNGRSFQTLIYLTPGVTFNMDEAGYSGQFTVNGQRGSSNYWMLDGVSANIGISVWYGAGPGTAGGVGAFNVLGGTNSLVSVDAMQEFRIQTSTYAPEFGRVPGGQISIVTRSGTNQFHGTVFDYFRNTVLDAKDWFASAEGLPKAAERQNDFGGVLGGPVVKDKTFFFFSYEGLRLRQPQTLLTTVPDLSARQNAIAAMQPFIDAFPLPNPGAADSGLGFAPFNSSFSDPSSVNAYSLRVDQKVSKNLTVFGRYNHSPSDVVVRGFGFSANTVWQADSSTNTGTVGTTWTKSSETVNETRFNYSSLGGNTSGRMDTFGGGAVAPGETVFPDSLTYNNAVLWFAPLSGTDMTYFEGRNAGAVQHQYNLVDTLSIQAGAHSLKFGADYRRLSPYFFARKYDQFVFFSSVPNVEAGTTSSIETDSTVPVTFLLHNLGVFAQDTWRISPRLTLTYGLRLDVDFAPTTESGPGIPAVTGFSSTDLSSLALAPAGTPPYNTRYGGVAPRVGAAYQISRSPEWTTVIRSGFGVFYDLASTPVGTYNLGLYPIGGTIVTIGPSFPPAAVVAAPPPIVPPNATQGTLFGFDPHLNVPYTLQWNVALEQALGTTQTFTVSYVGSAGRRLLATENVTEPNPNYLSAALIGNAGNSNYNALQTQFQRRLSRGLQALASYSWAHSIDTGSYGDYANGSFANVNINRGNSDFDIRNTFSAALTYDLPAFTRNAFTEAVSRGWSLDNILQAHSAPPVDILDAAFTSLAHQNSSILIRPDVVPGQPFYLYGSQYPGGKALNPNSFTPPPISATTGLPLRQGDLGRNSLRAFGVTQWDLAVHREFPLRESLKLQFRAETFNILNHPNFAPYDTNFGISDPYFGQSTQMLGQALSGVAGNGGQSALYSIGGPRSIQLALKLIF
jgi:hypothetical protein